MNSVVDLDTAISILQSALKVAYPGSPDFIDSQYRLGTALSRRYEQSQNPSDLQQALEAYRTALDLINPEHYDQKEIWQALPTTQAILGGRLVKEGKWQEGLQLLLNSVTQLSTGDNPLAHANALFQTGRAYETLSDWENARTYYRDALRLYKHLEELLGIARSQAGLGGVLVSQGYLQKGIVELKSASDLYNQLQKPEEAAELENLCQAAQKALERCAGGGLCMTSPDDIFDQAASNIERLGLRQIPFTESPTDLRSETLAHVFTGRDSELRQVF